jgi:hypothetical protein
VDGHLLLHVDEVVGEQATAGEHHVVSVLAVSGMTVFQFARAGAAGRRRRAGTWARRGW